MPIYADTQYDAQTQLDQLIAGLASELRLPNAGVRGAINVAIRGPEPDNPKPYTDEQGCSWAWAAFTWKR